MCPSASGLNFALLCFLSRRVGVNPVLIKTSFTVPKAVLRAVEMQIIDWYEHVEYVECVVTL